MNSLFSCFDVMCAEFLLGKKTFKTSFAASSSSSSPMTNIANDNNLVIGKQDRKYSSSPESTEKKSRKQIRSAPEFDGLNCFETFVSS